MSKKYFLETKELVDDLGFDIYASILADTICSLRTPANVGVFAGWGTGKSYLLHNINYKLTEYSKGLVTTTTSISMCFKLLFRLMFFHPPDSIRDSNKVRFITVHFNALEYAGSDHLWAGLVTRLVCATEAGIGILASAIFRAKPVNIFSRIARERMHSDKFRPKMLCGTKMPVYALWVFVIIICLGLGTSTLVYTLNKQATVLNRERHNSSTTYRNGTMSPDVKQSSVALGAVFLSIPVIAFFKNFIPVLLRIINTQQKEIRKIFSKPEFTQQLGVMAKIKGEIRHITKLVRYMELFEGRRIIVTIFIDDLDKLPQQTIAPLLQAIKILLSDPDSRFVSVIAMDPYSVAQALEMGIQSEFPSINISGHKFLKHLIQVPFSIPEMNKAEKSRLLKTLVVKNKLSHTKIHIGGKEKGPECAEEDVVDGKLNDDRKFIKPSCLGEEEETLLSSVKATDDLEMELRSTFDRETIEPLDQYGDVITACDVVLAQLRHKDICPFIKNNYQEMLRLIGIIKVTTRIIYSRLNPVKNDYFSDDLAAPIGILPFQLATWIVIVAQWPYKTTWIIQHVNDMGDDGNPYPISTPLSEVYQGIQPKISLVRNWKKLVKLDEDPNDLQDFLQLHKFWLNVEFLDKLLPYTISLDKSLKHIVASTSVEHDVKMNSNMPSKKLANMDVSDVVTMISNVCKDSVHLERYKQICREHSISGIVLLKGDMSEIKNCFKMVLGDWTRFSHCFLYMKNFSNHHIEF